MIEFFLEELHFEHGRPWPVVDKTLVEVVTERVNDGWNIYTFTKEWALLEREIS